MEKTLLEFLATQKEDGYAIIDRRDLVDFAHLKENGEPQNLLLCRLDDFIFAHEEGSKSVMVYNHVIDKEIGILGGIFPEGALHEVAEAIGEWFYTVGRKEVIQATIELISDDMGLDTDKLMEAVNKAVKDLDNIISDVLKERLKTKSKHK